MALFSIAAGIALFGMFTAAARPDNPSPGDAVGTIEGEAIAVTGPMSVSNVNGSVATVLHSGSGKFVLRQGPWVLIDARTGDDNGKHGEPEWFKQERGYTPNTAGGELYDLREDLIQRANLYAQKPEIVERLKALLEKYKADGRSTPGPAQINTPAGPGRKAGSIPDEK